MLVLSRREQERIRLGDSIVVTIVRVAGDRVKIGIEAPREVLILRDELEAHQHTSDGLADALVNRPGHETRFADRLYEHACERGTSI